MRASAAGVRSSAAGRWRGVVTVVIVCLLTFYPSRVREGTEGWAPARRERSGYWVPGAHPQPPPARGRGLELQHPQFQLGLVAHLLRVPGRIPDEVDVGRGDTRHRTHPQ